jgi:hypothetical protein
VSVLPRASGREVVKARLMSSRHYCEGIMFSHAAPNNGMHPTATRCFSISFRGMGRRVMPGVRPRM